MQSYLNLINFQNLFYLFLPFVLVNLGFGVLFLFSEKIYVAIRKIDYDEEFLNEISRKIVHFITAILFIIASYKVNYILNIILCLEALIALIVTKKFNLFSSAHKTRVVNDNQGIYYYIGGIIVSSILFRSNLDLVRISILILGISDSLASIVGRYHPVMKYNIFSNKSLAGSFIFFLTTFVIILSFPYSAILVTNLFQIFIISLTLTLLEAISYKGNDNIYILLVFPMLYQASTLSNVGLFLLILIVVTILRYYLMIKGKLGKFLL